MAFTNTTKQSRPGFGRATTTWAFSTVEPFVHLTHLGTMGMPRVPHHAKFALTLTASTWSWKTHYLIASKSSFIDSLAHILRTFLGSAVPSCVSSI